MQTKAEYHHAKEQLMRLDQRVLVDALLTLAQESQIGRASCRERV